MQYHALQYIFENKHIPIRLRVKLFDSAITATVLYSLDICLLAENVFRRLGVV